MQTETAQEQSGQSQSPAVTVHVPITFRRRGGRKLVITAAGETGTPSPRPHIDNTMVKALARAFRWRSLIENGAHATVRDLAKAEGINPSYVGRVLRLTLLNPILVEAILTGRQPPEMSLADLLEPFPISWKDQDRLWRAVRGRAPP